MRKLIPGLLTLFLVTQATAQGWISQATGFTAASRGINAIIIVDKNTAWATAYDGTGISQKVRDYTRTSDGGDSWTAGTVTVLSSNYAWSCLSALDATTAWAAFYRVSGTLAEGLIYRTTDGSTWTQQGAGVIYENSSSFPNVVHFWDANTGMAMGDPINSEYEIYTTADGGATWALVNGANIPAPASGEFGIVSVYTTYGNTIWFGTNKGRVYKSTDQGKNWTVSETGFSYWVDQILFKDDLNGWLTADDNDGGGDHVFLRTTDGGATWTALPEDLPYHYGSVSFVPLTTNTLVCTGIDFTNDDLGSSYSLDGGETWVIIDEGEQRGVVEFYNNTTGWAGGFNVDDQTDGIFKFDGGFVATGTGGLDETTSLGLYPNPGDGLFYFSYETSNREPVYIRVTDGMGKQVFSKEYQDKSQTWLRSLDLRSFEKGVYFFTLENGQNHAARKLVIQ